MLLLGIILRQGTTKKFFACFYIHPRLKRKQIVRAQDKRSNRMVKKKGMLRLNYGISLPIESFRVWKTTDK